MKDTKPKQTVTVHTVTPIGDPSEAAEDGLYDDCPLCQQLRKDRDKKEMDEWFDEVTGKTWFRH